MTICEDYDLAAPGTYEHGIPHEVFAELRRTEPVSWRAERGGRGFWAVTRYEDVIKVLRAPQEFSSWRGGALIADPPPEFLDKLREGLLNRDPPDHTQLRRLVNKALSPRRIEKLDHAVREHARKLITTVRERGRCNFATDVAREMPLFMISEILGVPEADRQSLHALTIRTLGTEIEDPQVAWQDQMAAANQLRAYGAELRRTKRAHPVDDLASELSSAELDGRPLTEGEFQAFFMLLFNAGTDTTRGLLSYGLNLLIDRPETIARLRSQPEQLPNAIEEMLRFESLLIQVRRTASRDTQLRGQQICEGDKVVVFFPSANRDETVFIDPDRFEIERTPNDHLAFGFGTHHCLGAPLARLEAKHVFTEVLEQLGEIERVSPVQHVRSNFVRALRSLEIKHSALD